MDDELTIDLVLDGSQVDQGVAGAANKMDQLDKAIARTQNRLDAFQRTAGSSISLLNLPSSSAPALQATGNAPAPVVEGNNKPHSLQTSGLLDLTAADNVGRKIGEGLRRSSTATSEAAAPFESKGLDILGMAGSFGSALGGWTEALQSGAQVLKAFADAVQGAADRENSFSSASYISGGTPEETARIQVMAKAAGLDEKSVAGVAAQFSNSLGHSPMAMSAFHDYDQPGPFGKIDKAAQLLRGIDHLMDRGISREQAQRAAMAAPELQPFLRLRDLSDDDRKQMNAWAGDRADIYGKNPQEAASVALRLAMLQSRTQEQIDKSLVEIGGAINGALGHDEAKQGKSGPAFPVKDDDSLLMKGLKWLGNGFVGEATGFDKILNPAGSHQADLAGSPLGGGSSNASDKPSFADPLIDALNRNSDAVDRNAVAIRDLSRHVYGGGERAREASPSHSAYQNTTNFLRDNRLRFAGGP